MVSVTREHIAHIKLFADPTGAVTRSTTVSLKPFPHSQHEVFDRARISMVRRHSFARVTSAVFIWSLYFSGFFSHWSAKHPRAKSPIATTWALKNEGPFTWSTVSTPRPFGADHGRRTRVGRAPGKVDGTPKTRRRTAGVPAYVCCRCCRV